MPPSTVSSSRSGSQGRTDRTLTPVSDDSAPLLGHYAQALIVCNQKLRELGIHNTIKVPQVSVIGDQSTGKSSLIEAISTIKVPKAKGCCTQCPLAINLSSGQNALSPWKCTIYIEEHYEFVQSLATKGVTKANPFGPWQKRDQMSLLEVKTTHDKDEIPDLIRAAQHVVLNPGSHIEDYLGNRLRKGAVQVAKFSPNVIRLDVSEGNWPNLSFVDLPGVIANTSKEEDKYLVKLIRNLVQKYAAADRSINMLTLPMTHDVENSSACAIIQELKAEANTLAVFTKADLAEDDQRDQILQKFTGSNDLNFQHGYHFVVMPDGVEQEEARNIEANMFAQEPWSLLDEKHKARYGVERLTAYLRCLLFKKTAETLPDNLKSIQNRITEVDAELSTLPPPPNAVLLPLQLQQSVTQFENAMKCLLSGDGTSPGVTVRNLWTQNTVKFRDTVTKARPTLYLMSHAETTRLSKAKAKVHSSQNGAGISGDAIELSSGDEAQSSIPVKTEQSTPQKFDATHRFRFEEIQQINGRYYQAYVPGEIELKAVEEMNRLSVQHWDKLLHDYMDANSKLLSKQIGKVVEHVFGHHSHLDVFSVIQDHVKECLNDMIQQEWTLAEEACRLEQEGPSTYDVSSLKRKEAICVNERRQKREEKRLELFRAEAELTERSGKRKSKKDDADLGPDPFETELLMSAENRAYYEVASTRFVDNISLGISVRLLPACSKRLVEDLKDHLGLNDPSKHDQIIAWMTENPERERKRQQLVQEKTQLSEGLRYIEDVLGTNGSITRSPPKRRSNESPETDNVLKTPSKRSKTTYPNGNDESLTLSTGRGLASRIRSMEVED